MTNTKIEWCDYSWNPITGCTKISDGCKNCYAERMSKRLAGRAGYPADDPFRVTYHSERMNDLVNCRKPRKIFVCSMGDLFHKDVKFQWIINIFDIIELCREHTFISLTKRPDRMKKIIDDLMTTAMFEIWEKDGEFEWPLPNLWLGVSVENQEAADERIPLLLQTPAAVRFVSCEPLLEDIDVSGALHGFPIQDVYHQWYQSTQPINWIICGGETGPGARYMNPDWARSLRDQCKDAGIPFFMKQMSKREPIPDDLMIREFPQ